MFVSLHSLSDSDILSRTQSLTARERTLTLLVLLHLNEIERRKLHLKQGYSSMFDYCTSGLGYSEPAAFRRIRTARCVVRFPEVYRLLQAGKVNLSTITRVSRVLTAANQDVLLARIRGKSLREVDAIVAEYQPRAVPRDAVRRVVVRMPVAPPPTPTLAFAPRADPTGPAAGTGAPFVPPDGASNLEPAVATGHHAGACDTRAPFDAGADGSMLMGDACEKSAYFRREGVFHPTDGASPTEPIALERRIQFRFTTTPEFQRKLEKIKALAWHRLPVNASLEQVFELALDAFIERHDPSARRERRDRRREREKTQTKPCTATPQQDRQPDNRSRYVAAAVRDQVFGRDDHRCAFVSPHGRRCAATTALQIDHIEPFARGGANTGDNLRLLCACHNRLEAERLLGPHARRPG